MSKKEKLARINKSNVEKNLKEKNIPVHCKMISQDNFISNQMQVLVKETNKVLTGYKDDQTHTGPTFRHAENNITLSYNIYPLDESLEQKIWSALKTHLKAFFKELSKQGEVIFFDQSKGSIYDQGKEYFLILEASHFECYLYEPESFIYCRLLKEFDPLKKKTWISIDVDAVNQSAWFTD